MMTTRTIKSGDTGIQFTSTLKKDGTAIDLTGCTVVMLLKIGTTQTSHSATIVSAVAGTVKCIPGGSFPTAPGVYKQEWEVTLSDSKILSFPSDGYNYVEIQEDLN